MTRNSKDIEADVCGSPAAMYLDIDALGQVHPSPRASEPEDGLSDTSTAVENLLQVDHHDPLQIQWTNYSRGLAEPPMGTMAPMFDYLPSSEIASNAPSSEGNEVLPTLSSLFNKDTFIKTLSGIFERGKQRKVNLDKRLKWLETNEDYIEKTSHMSEEERRQYDTTLSSNNPGDHITKLRKDFFAQLEGLRDDIEKIAEPLGKHSQAGRSPPRKTPEAGGEQIPVPYKIEQEKADSEAEPEEEEKTKKTKSEKDKARKKAQKRRQQERRRTEAQKQQDVTAQDSASRNASVQEGDEENDPITAEISDADISKVLVNNGKQGRELSKKHTKKEEEQLKAGRAFEKLTDEKLEKSEVGQKEIAGRETKASNLQTNQDEPEKPKVAKKERKTGSFQPNPAGSAKLKAIETKDDQASDDKTPAKERRKAKQADADRKLAEPTAKAEEEETAKSAGDSKIRKLEEQQKARQEEEDRIIAEQIQAQEDAKAFTDAKRKKAEKAEDLAKSLDAEKDKAFRQQANVAEAEMLKKIGEARVILAEAERLKEKQEMNAKEAKDLMEGARHAAEDLEVKIDKAVEEGKTKTVEELEARRRKTLEMVDITSNAEKRASAKIKVHQMEEDKARENLILLEIQRQEAIKAEKAKAPDRPWIPVENKKREQAERRKILQEEKKATLAKTTTEEPSAAFTTGRRITPVAETRGKALPQGGKWATAGASRDGASSGSGNKSTPLEKASNTAQSRSDATKDANRKHVAAEAENRRELEATGAEKSKETKKENQQLGVVKTSEASAVKTPERRNPESPAASVVKPPTGVETQWAIYEARRKQTEREKAEEGQKKEETKKKGKGKEAWPVLPSSSQQKKTEAWGNAPPPVDLALKFMPPKEKLQGSPKVDSQQKAQSPSQKTQQDLTQPTPEKNQEKVQAPVQAKPQEKAQAPAQAKLQERVQAPVEAKPQEKVPAPVQVIPQEKDQGQARVSAWGKTPIQSQKKTEVPATKKDRILPEENPQVPAEKLQSPVPKKPQPSPQHKKQAPTQEKAQTPAQAKPEPTHSSRKLVTKKPNTPIQSETPAISFKKYSEVLSPSSVGDYSRLNAIISGGKNAPLHIQKQLDFQSKEGQPEAQKHESQNIEREKAEQNGHRKAVRERVKLGKESEEAQTNEPKSEKAEQNGVPPQLQKLLDSQAKEDQLKAQKLDTERIEREKAEKDERERAEHEKAEKRRVELEKIEKFEREMVEQQRLEREKTRKAEQVEQQRVERKKQAQKERLEREKTEQAEREKAEQAQRNRLEHEKTEKAKREKAEQAEQQRVEREKAHEKAEQEKAKQERERVEREKAKKDEREKAQRERAKREEARKKAEQSKAEQERLNREEARRKDEQKKAEQDRIARENTENEKAKQAKAEYDKAERDKSEKERIVRLKAKLKKAELDQAELERIAREKAESRSHHANSEQKRPASEKVKLDKPALGKVALEKAAPEDTERGKGQLDDAEHQRLDREKAEREETKHAPEDVHMEADTPKPVPGGGNTDQESKRREDGASDAQPTSNLGDSKPELDGAALRLRNLVDRRLEMQKKAEEYGEEARRLDEKIKELICLRDVNVKLREQELEMVKKTVEAELRKQIFVEKVKLAKDQAEWEEVQQKQEAKRQSQDDRRRLFEEVESQFNADTSLGWAPTADSKIPGAPEVCFPGD